MKVLNMLKLIKISILAGACVIGAGCAEQVDTGNADQYLDSAAVTKKVKTQLMNQFGPAALRIRVRTYHDEVLLSGVVDNAMIQQKAGQIAAHVEHVKHVRNDLVVR